MYGEANARPEGRDPDGDNALRSERLCLTGELDRLIFGDEDDDACVFDLPLAAQVEHRERHVRAAYDRHLETCAPYRQFVERLDGPRSGADLATLGDVPVIPTSVFKRLPPLSVPERDVARWATSSGTRGVLSRVPRDRLSLERLLGSVRAGMKLVSSFYEDELEVINLGPDREAAGQIWFAYVMSLVELLHPTSHQVVEGRFDLEGTVAELEAALADAEQVAIVGPPVLALELLSFMNERGIRLEGGDRVRVVTAGGWKRFSGQAIARDELESLLVDRLGLASGSQVRDAFNQVELNAVFMECSSHRKHVPPWVHAMARDPKTLRPLPRGETGLLSFLDASALSFPAFIVSDDVGVVEEGLCPCGREGVFVSIARRVEGRARRGCALSMDRAYAEPQSTR